MKFLEAAESSYITRSLASDSGVHSGAGPPSAGKPNQHSLAASLHVAFRDLRELQS